MSPSWEEPLATLLEGPTHIMDPPHSSLGQTACHPLMAVFHLSCLIVTCLGLAVPCPVTMLTQDCPTQSKGHSVFRSHSYCSLPL